MEEQQEMTLNQESTSYGLTNAFNDLFFDTQWRLS